MSYSEPLIFQLNRFLIFLGVGFLLGFVWRALQFLRALFGEGRCATVALDVLFCAAAFLALFCSSLSFANGRIRLHLVFSAALGYSAFLLTLGRPLNRLLSLLANRFNKLGRMLLRPFAAGLSVLKRCKEKQQMALIGLWKRQKARQIRRRKEKQEKSGKKEKKIKRFLLKNRKKSV